MATLNVLLYSTLDTQRYVYKDKDTDGVLVADIDSTFRNKCSVRSLRNHGALVEVCSETREALQELENKYDTTTHFHIRKLKAFISNLSDGQYFYYDFLVEIGISIPEDFHLEMSYVDSMLDIVPGEEICN